MKHVIIALILCAGIPLDAGAQTYTQRLQEVKAGQGTVTIHESADIDQLVNSAVLTTKAPVAATTPKAATTGTTPKGTTTSPTSTTTKPATPNTTTPVPTTLSSAGEENAETLPDYNKKMMRGVKVSGYRVQAFAGGNSRKDRQKAERIGNDIKAQFAGVPVYVHFYSPRWICRVGNYRTYEEAHQMLLSLRKMGYDQATIVKGKITVQY